MDLVVRHQTRDSEEDGQSKLKGNIIRLSRNLQYLDNLLVPGATEEIAADRGVVSFLVGVGGHRSQGLSVTQNRSRFLLCGGEGDG